MHIDTFTLLYAVYLLLKGSHNVNLDIWLAVHHSIYVNEQEICVSSW